MRTAVTGSLMTPDFNYGQMATRIILLISSNIEYRPEGSTDVSDISLVAREVLRSSKLR